MMLRRVLLFALLLIIPSSIVFCAAQTSDDTDALTKTDDIRLDQKINFDSDGLPVGAVLAQLSKISGVDMVAGQDKDDWMVYDRKVILHVTNIQLRSLMRQIGTVLKFHWSRGGDTGKWSYRLWQDKQQRVEEQTLRDSTEDSQVKQQREKRENFVADIANLSSLSEANVSALKATDPWRYILATEPLGKDVAGFINSFADARTAFLQGIEISFPVSTLPSNVQDMVKRIATSYDSLTKSVGASEDHSSLLNQFDKLQVTINRNAAKNGKDIISKGLLGQITISSGIDSLDIPLFDPSSVVARALGKAIVSLKSGVPKSDVESQLKVDITSASNDAQPGKTEVARDIVSDSSMSARLKLFDEPTNSSLIMILRNLAGKTNYNIVSDYYPSAPIKIDSSEQTLGEILEMIRNKCGANWTKDGNLLRFVDRDWYKKRAWAVPEVWLNYWIVKGRSTNGLQLWELAQIASLRDDQIDHTIMINHELISLGAGDAARNREILKFYGMLSDDQLQKIATQSLPVSSLTDQQWAELQKALATKGAAYATVKKGTQVIKLSDSSADGEYKFIFYPGGTEQPVEFKISCGVMIQQKPVDSLKQ